MWIRKRWQQFRVEKVGVPYPIKTLRPLKYTHMRQSLGDCLLLSSLLQHPFDFFFNLEHYPWPLNASAKPFLLHYVHMQVVYSYGFICFDLFVQASYTTSVWLNNCCQCCWIYCYRVCFSDTFLSFITSAQIKHISFHTFVAFTARLLNVMVSHNMWRTWVTQHYVSYCHYQKILFFLVVFMWLFLLSHTEGEA